jgi:hypothetical protein
MSINNIILEISKNKLLSNTDAPRKFRSKSQVRTRPPKVTELDDGIEFIEYQFRAYPSTQNMRHWGYILYDNEKKDIREGYCDCKDFAFRLFRPYQRAKLLNPDKIPKKYLDHAATIPTRQWTKKTNPKGKIYLCKHMVSLMNYL